MNIPRATTGRRPGRQPGTKYPKTALKAQEQRMPDLTAELDDTERVTVASTPVFKEPMTQAARELESQGHEPVVDLDAVSTGVRMRRKRNRDESEVSPEERKRLGIKPGESLCWARSDWWMKVESGSRAREIKQLYNGEARVVKDPDTNEPVERKDLVLMAYPKWYDDERQDEIDSSAYDAFSQVDNDGSLIPDVSKDILPGDPGSMAGRQNWERVKRTDEGRRNFLEVRKHLNARQAQSKGWLGPASKTHGDTVEEVLEVMARRLGSKEAASNEFMRQQAMARGNKVGGEMTEERMQHERKMREVFKQSRGKSVSYSIPASAGK